MTEKNWMGKSEPTMVKRSSPLSKHFDSDEWTIELIPRRMADVTLSWSGLGTHKTTGKTREFGPYKTWAEIINFCGAFRGFKEVKPGQHEAEEQRKELLQGMINAGELPTGLQGEAKSLGLSLTPTASTTTPAKGRFSAEDNAVFFVFCHGEPQNAAMLPIDDEKHPHRYGSLQRQEHNKQVIADYFHARPDLPVTIENLGVAYRTLDGMGCIEHLNTRHRAQGPIFGGRAYNYSPDRDPSFKRQQTYTEAEIIAVSQQFPMNTTLTPDVVIAKLGETPLAHAIIGYWQKRGGR